MKLIRYRNNKLISKISVDFDVFFQVMHDFCIIENLHIGHYAGLSEYQDPVHTNSAIISAGKSILKNNLYANIAYLESSTCTSNYINLNFFGENGGMRL